MAYSLMNKLIKFRNNKLKQAAESAANSTPKATSAQTNISGSVYTSRAKTAVPRNGDSYGVRAEMNNMGLDNSKIGWQDGYVTYNGLKLKPSYVKDDTSYASKQDIQSFVNAAYKTEGKNPVRITDYAAPAGMGGISYSANGMVSVAGEDIPVLYMDGDRAVVDSKALDSAYAKAKNRLGISTADELYKKWNSQYKNPLKNAYRSLADYGDWKYNPAQDPAYRAYSDMYRREGERAYRDAAAKFTSRNNGNMTSAAQSVANQQLNYYMSQLADRIPELEKNSYERYKNGFDMRKQSYDALRAEAENAWKMLSEKNTTAKQDYADRLDSERKRTENAQNDLMAKLNAEGKQISNAAELQGIDTARFENAWNNAIQRGYFTDAEAKLLNIPKKANGEYLKPIDVKINNDKQYYNNVTMPQLKYKAKLDSEAQTRALNLKHEYTNQEQQAAFEYDKQLAAYRASLKQK